MSLGVSCGIPLLIQKKQSEDYDLPGLIFDSHYMEVVDQVNTIEKKDYIELVDKIKHKGEELMSSNNKMVQEFVHSTFSSTEIILVCIKVFQEYIKLNIVKYSWIQLIIVEYIMGYSHIQLNILEYNQIHFDTMPMPVAVAMLINLIITTVV